MKPVRVFWLALLCGLAPMGAQAFSGETANAIADVFVWVVIVLVPVLVVWLFWKVHVMPEIIAEKRQHPQKEAIQTLCLLSLAFGGLLWPLAWLWAMLKPVGYKLAYGRDKHDDYYAELDADSSSEPASFLHTPDQRIAQLEVEVAALKMALSTTREESLPAPASLHDSPIS